MLTFGLIGGGSISHSHIIGVTFGNNAIFKAGCFSRDHHKNLEYGTHYSVDESRIYSDYQTMLDQESQRSDRLDFVIVTTPNISHFEIVLACMKHKFNVVCDKPLCTTVEQAKLLQQVAAQNDLICSTSYTFGGFPFIHLAKALLDAGEIGRPYYMTLKYYRGSRLAEIYANNIKTWRFTESISGQGGTIADLGTHVDYLARLIIGSDIDRVLARLINKPGNVELDTTGTILFDFKNGLEGTILIAQAACGHDNDIEFEILGEKGTINWNFNRHAEVRVDYLDGKTVTHRDPGVNSFSVRQFDLKGPNVLNAPVTGFINIYSGYINAILSKGLKEKKDFFFPSLADGVKGVCFVEACIKSQKAGNQWVELD